MSCHSWLKGHLSGLKCLVSAGKMSYQLKNKKYTFFNILLENPYFPLRIYVKTSDYLNRYIIFLPDNFKKYKSRDYFLQIFWHIMIVYHSTITLLGVINVEIVNHITFIDQWITSIFNYGRIKDLVSIFWDEILDLKL